MVWQNYIGWTRSTALKRRNWVLSSSQFLWKLSLALSIFGGQLAPITEDIPVPSHGRIFCEKFHYVYVVKGVWRLLTYLLFKGFGTWKIIIN